MAKAALEEKAHTVILDYMKQANRPYSIVDVFTNLRQEFGKTLVLKVLEAGVASEVLKEKAVGKQKIFFANQANLEQFDDSVLKEYDEQINSQTAQLEKFSSAWRELQTELKGVTCLETTPQLVAAQLQLRNKISEMETRLTSLEENNNTDAEQEGVRAIQDEENVKKILKKRKRIGTELLNAIREGCPLPKKQLFDSIGLDIHEKEL